VYTCPTALRNAKKFLISDGEFEAFKARHSSVPTLVAEPNAVMRASYFLLDEEMCFLDCSQGGKQPSVSIFDDLERALKQAGFAEKERHQRDGAFYQNLQSKRARILPEVEVDQDDTANGGIITASHITSSPRSSSLTKHTPQTSACQLVDF